MGQRVVHAKPAFPPDGRGLGGAQLISAEYTSHYDKAELAYHRARDAAVSRPSLGWQDPKLSMAQRLSSNRAKRRGAVDITAVEHIHRLYHMHRRIEESYSIAERRKNPNDTVLWPVYKKRSAAARGVQHRGLSSYTPKGETPRYGPAMKQHPEGDQYVGWSISHSLVDAEPNLYPRRSAVKLHRGYTAYYKAIVADILEARMYRESDLRRLFHHYLQMVPLGEKQVVEEVVTELRHQFDVR